MTAYSGVTWIVDSRGYALILEGPTYSVSKVCAINLASSYLAPGSACPVSASAVGFGYTNGQLTSYTNSVGGIYNFGYDSNKNLTCIQEPGSAACKVNDTYTACANNGATAGGYSYRVTSQTLADGTSYAFSYNPTYCHPIISPPDPPNPTSQTIMIGPGSATTTVNFFGGQPTSAVDPLSHMKSIGVGYQAEYGYSWQIGSTTNPEGDTLDYGYDARGNITSLTHTAKSGSGLSQLTTTSTYPATCATRKTCNKPTSVTDANGHTTDYTYDDAHGGVLTESSPADANGARAVKRSAYVQRYAWIANGSGGFVHAGGPIWVLDQERTCRTTATSAGATGAQVGCAGGSSDEVVTAYDYGPDTGAVGNNLLLRGVSVTADGQTRRTCYGYDAMGNRIWETKPRAGLAACY